MKYSNLFKIENLGDKKTINSNPRAEVYNNNI